MPLARPSTLAMTVDSVGGVWRYALDLAGELVRRDLAVTLVGLGPEPSPAQVGEAEGAGVELAWLEAPLDWTTLDGEGQRAGARALQEFLRKRRPDVLHLNTPAFAALLERRPPTLVTAHSCLATWWHAMRSEPLPQEWQEHARNTAAGLAAAEVVTAPTQAFAEQLRQCYGEIDRLRVVPNGSRPAEPGSKAPLVFSAGRWWDEAKNLAALEAAAGDMVWPLYAAGPLTGPESEAPHPAHLQCLGSLDAPEMARWHAMASIFVSPARYEPFGLAVLEAAGAGAALVLSDIPGFRELWGNCAVFADPDRPEQFAKGVNALAANPERRAALARAAQERAADFTIGRQVDALLPAYAEAATARRQAA